MTTSQQPALSIDDIVENFALLDEWDDRYRYVIELGRKLAPFPEQERNEVNKVRGCASQVWLATTVYRSNGETVLTFMGDSDAHIVRGLVAILIALLSGRPARQIAKPPPETSWPTPCPGRFRSPRAMHAPD